MSKAILILDKMPRDCPCCPVAHYNKLDEFTGCDIVGGKRYAMTTEEGYRYTSERPTWCPLKPLPSKKEVKGDFYKQREIATHQTTLIDFDKGYNKAIDEILGENEQWKK